MKVGLENVAADVVVLEGQPTDSGTTRGHLEEEEEEEIGSKKSEDRLCCAMTEGTRTEVFAEGKRSE